MTRTTPLRLTIWQFSQIRRTLDRTFITITSHFNTTALCAIAADQAI
jgi:hypothetical protein